jgi:hypothetical protein
MENEIINIVNKVINFYRSESSSDFTFWVDNFNRKDDIIKYVLYKKDVFNPNRGSFNGYFGTITKRYILFLYRLDKEKIKLITERDFKLNQCIN